MYAAKRSQVFMAYPSRYPNLSSSRTEKGSYTIKRNSSRHSGLRSGIIVDSTCSCSYSSRMSARPSMLVFIGLMTSLVRTSGRSWNSAV